VGGCPAQTNPRDRRISFRRFCFAEFYQHNPSDFCTVLSDPEYQARHYATAQTALGGEHFCCRNLRFKGSPKKLKQNSNPFFRRQQMSNHDLQSLKRPFCNLNRFANFDRGIDSHDFFRTHSRLKRDYNSFRQGCQAIPKADDPSDSVRTFNGAMLFRIDKFREQITGKHRLHEPDWPPLGHLAETQSRRETLDVKLTPERGRGQMLSLRLRL